MKKALAACIMSFAFFLANMSALESIIPIENTTYELFRNNEVSVILSLKEKLLLEKGIVAFKCEYCLKDLIGNKKLTIYEGRFLKQKNGKYEQQTPLMASFDVLLNNSVLESDLNEDGIMDYSLILGPYLIDLKGPLLKVISKGKNGFYVMFQYELVGDDDSIGFRKIEFSNENGRKKVDLIVSYGSNYLETRYYNEKTGVYDNDR